ncbi:hypothetical protein GWK47_049549 [Chionoecetes opilio]|uniref:Uncharacterized protein n=1 Tax=Chionoecetes opilio TaxID=41210 RepID=A0A8J4Y9Y0_CHIOP|nr:hypothetical protein GWK47_049549 [Chionoecetes opilio]
MTHRTRVLCATRKPWAKQEHAVKRREERKRVVVPLLRICQKKLTMSLRSWRHIKDLGNRMTMMKWHIVERSGNKVRKIPHFSWRSCSRSRWRAKPQFQAPSSRGSCEDSSRCQRPPISGMKRKPSRTRRALYDDDTYTTYTTYDQEKEGRKMNE